MKPVKQFTLCEFCNSQIILASPPLDEQYEQGRIEIMAGWLLLPSHCRKNNSVQSTSLNGYYCDRECLANRISQLLEYSGNNGA